MIVHKLKSSMTKEKPDDLERDVQNAAKTTTNKLLPTILANLFVEINSTFGHAKELILKAYNTAIQEKYTPQQALQLLLENITVFKKTQIYACLPPECKNPIKQKAGSVSHKVAVSIPKSEQKTEMEQTHPVSHLISRANEADNDLARLQSENLTLKREIENISDNVIPEALMKKDRQIGELQKEKEELKLIYETEVQQLESRISKDSFVSAAEEQQLNDAKPQHIKKQARELTKKMFPKTYYKNLPLPGDVALPIQVDIYPENDECMLEVDVEVAQKVFARVCKELG
jgi:hypothetical protein